MLANLLDQNKIKNINLWKDIRKRAKRKPTEWKEIFAMHILAKVFYSKFKINKEKEYKLIGKGRA